MFKETFVSSSKGRFIHLSFEIIFFIINVFFFLLFNIFLAIDLPILFKLDCKEDLLNNSFI